MGLARDYSTGGRSIFEVNVSFRLASQENELLQPWKKKNEESFSVLTFDCVLLGLRPWSHGKDGAHGGTHLDEPPAESFYATRAFCSSSLRLSPAAIGRLMWAVLKIFKPFRSFPPLSRSHPTTVGVAHFSPKKGIPSVRLSSSREELAASHDSSHFTGIYISFWGLRHREARSGCANECLRNQFFVGVRDTAELFRRGLLHP